MRIKHLLSRNRKLNQIPPSQWTTGTLYRMPSHSEILGETRQLDIYLPPGYHKSRESYPVLYMHDGNNLFYPELAFGGTAWRVNHVVDKLVNHKLLNKIIVVGVHNTMARNEEYTWTEMARGPYREGGKGPFYASYLVEELKPLIDRSFRTRKGKRHTAVMGSSLGGLISFYLGRFYSGVFGHIGCVSPSFWWDDRAALSEAQEYPKNLNIWLDMGTREGGEKVKIDQNANILNLRRAKRALEARGYTEGKNLGYLEVRGGLHNEWHWGERLHLPLLFFFGKKNMILKP